MKVHVLGAVHNDIVSKASNDTEATTAATPDQLLASGSGVVNVCRHLDILVGAQSGLVSGAETPTMCLPITCNRNTMICPCCSPDCIYTLNLSWDGQNARVSSGVVDDVSFVELVDLKTELEAIETSPDEQFACIGDGNGVMSTSFDVCYASLVLTKRLDDGRVVNIGFAAIADVFYNAGFTEAVEAPAVDVAVGTDCEGVVCAGADGNHLFGQAELGGDEGVHFGAFENAATELILLARAPGKDLLFVIEGEDVVGAGGEGDDLFQGGEESWTILDEDVRLEAEDAFVGLYTFSMRSEKEGGRLTLNVPQP